MIFIFSSGFDSFSNTGNRNTRANNYLNYEPEQVHYQDRVLLLHVAFSFFQMSPNSNATVQALSVSTKASV